MKAFLRSILVLFAIYFITGSFKKPESKGPGFIKFNIKKNNKTGTGGIARWTGKVTFEAVIIHSNAAFNGKVEIHASASFIDALPTLHRDDGSTNLNFTDDKGQGHHKVHTEITDILKKTCIADCDVNGQAELHEVVVNEETNTYDIDVLFPDCVGTGNCVQNGVFKADPASATVSNHQLTNKNLLAGTNTVSGELPGGLGTYTRTTTWYLERSKPPEAELIVTPVDYNNWLPDAGKDELSKGSVMTINLKLRGKNGKPLTVKAESFELRLSNTSIEPGITINYPVEKSATQLPDLRFLMHPGIESFNEDQSIIAGSPDGITGKALIASYDGGGRTTLTVEATLSDSSRILGRLLVSNGDIQIRIPKRDPNSAIAEKWLKDNGNPGESDDKEESTGNPNNGDGLSAYEEYRGVISRGAFKRLDPAKKELGVMVKKAEYSLFAGGISLFETATTIKAITFYETEIGTDRRLNKNILTANVYKQYVEKLDTASLEEGTVGENQPAQVLAKIPRLSERVVIDIIQIKANYINQARAAAAGGVQMPYTAKETIDNTIAHELAHGINVNHHGPPTPQSSREVIVPPNSQFSIYRIFDSFGQPITDRPFTIPGLIGIRGNDESGNLSCIMAYTSQYQWARSTEPDGSVNYYAVKLLPVGKTICSSGDGNGINANNKFFGNTLSAKYGNCRSQIKLKD